MLENYDLIRKILTKNTSSPPFYTKRFSPNNSTSEVMKCIWNKYVPGETDTKKTYN